MMLNKRKGPAVQAPRAQCDKDLYHRFVLHLLEQLPNLQILEDADGAIVVTGRITFVDCLQAFVGYRLETEED